MSLQPIVLSWIQNRNIRSVINAPAGKGRDIPLLRSVGVKRILNVDIQVFDANDPEWVQANLEDFFPPDGPWNAVYINCFFCLSNKSPTDIGLAKNPSTDFHKSALNIARWPARYWIVYDTAYGYDWEEDFKTAGLELAQRAFAPDGPDTRIELWQRAGSQDREINEWNSEPPELGG